MKYFVIFLILIGFAGLGQLSFAEINYPDALKIPFNDSDLVLVGTIISKDEISKNQTKYGIDVEDYLKNTKSFDMISAISYETKNQTEPYTEVHYYNEPFFDVGQKVFVYLKMNKSGEYIMSPYSFAIEKNEPKGPPPSVIWMTGPTKFQFNQGEEVIISGLVKKAYLYDSVQRGQDPSINLKIFDKNNELLVSEKLNAKVDGTYEYPFQIKGESHIPGKYSYEIQFGPETMNGEFIIEINPNLWTPLKQIKAGIAVQEIQCKNDLHVLTERPNGKVACVYGSTAEKLGWKIINPDIHDISVFEVVKDDVIFDVGYTVKGGVVEDMAYNANTTSLLITIDSTDEGNLTLSIPRTLMDSGHSNCDPYYEREEPFAVLINHEEVLFDEIATTSEKRTLSISFQENTKKIEIISFCLI